MADIVWVVPETRGGIASYASVLWPAVKKAAEAGGYTVSAPLRDNHLALQEIISSKPRLVHVQHEFGLFGSKVPPLYYFPDWVQHLRKELPSTAIIATGHTILDPEYSYPVEGRGWQIPFRILANTIAKPWLKKTWIDKTWGDLDGVIVHSILQEKTVRESGCRAVRVIPHFVQPSTMKQIVHPIFREIPENVPIVLIFGYITPEKGQDIAIQAFAQLRTEAHLILAGGTRRKEDRAHMKKCKELIRSMGLDDKITLTGILGDNQLDEFFKRASLVLAPFRETSGSGSLAQALARGCAILASDLPINQEIAERETGCLAFFKSEDFMDCAVQIERLLENQGLRSDLSVAAKRYAESHSPDKIAQQHIEFYQDLLKQNR